MEAEFIACYEASNQGIWLRNFITGLHIVDGIERPLKINCDNKAAELYSKNNRSSSKSKHIDIKFLVVKERVQSSQICIEHISTNFMIADPLTKGLPPKVFHEHVARMGVICFDMLA
ncbi:Retrovirus-related Pol polyprotein from transposon TNT 1-94 [Dendrobium catenatum]|uniref:Retrovirus-related Pol polyprotein from transposon TNT 1-94 n=1 Tax=Dendrobium catenatum TaxID=906689 RepID=A0A2I0X167_9ASPA|nr:Retrovirus-related Pol polyprotein from transposon TNT 1-94 [Dendrobium catenatum]